MDDQANILLNGATPKALTTNIRLGRHSDGEKKRAPSLFIITKIELA